MVVPPQLRAYPGCDCRRRAGGAVGLRPTADCADWMSNALTDTPIVVGGFLERRP